MLSSKTCLIPVVTSFPEYETAMGRILAVNMEHIKRSIADERQRNVFGEIEQNNESKKV